MTGHPGIFEIIEGNKRKKVVFCIPVAPGGAPHPKTIASLEAAIPLVKAHGWEEGLTQTLGNPYISGARAEMTRKALDAQATHIFYIDYDVAFRPQDVLDVLEAEGDVVSGTYRVKTEDDSDLYMGAIYTNEHNQPIGRMSDGALKARVVPAGFLRVTTGAIEKFMNAYPELCFGPQFHRSIDLFNHGAYNSLWWGEDYAFARRYNDKCGDVWLLPWLQIDHWKGDHAWKGNFHEYLMQQNGANQEKYEEWRKEKELEYVG
jgi:hypothetical protein